MRKELKKIIIAAVIFTAGIILKYTWPRQGLYGAYYNNIILAVFLMAYLIVGFDVLKEAIENIMHGEVFDENFLMAVASIGAFFVGEYPEAAAVMLFYSVGEYFEESAVDRSRKSIADLMDIRPDHACVKRNGDVVTVDPSDVRVGEIIVVKPGDRVPLDSVIKSGTTSIDTMALTGESVPREAGKDDALISGCINITGVIEAEVTKTYGESTVSKILELVSNASDRKSESENFITKFARYYTPVVVGAAAILAVIPPLITGAGEWSVWKVWIYRALTFLVISCPCALVISVPLSFFAGLGGASRNGILIKGSNFVEALAKTETVVFDKTGTLTKGVFRVTGITAEEGVSEDHVLSCAAMAEYYSTHPIALSLKDALKEPIDENDISNVQNTAGAGISANVKGHVILAGNTKMMTDNRIGFRVSDEAGTAVYVAEDGIYIGCIVISDEVKDDSAEAVELLKKQGVKKCVMLTGDRKTAGEAAALKIGIDEVHTELLPEDKVNELEKLLKTKSGGSSVAFVGDGINDAPVIARSDVGIAMGALGSDAAIEAADVVIMDDKPSKIAFALRIAKKTLVIVYENIIFAIGVKVLVLILAAAGLATMWAAVFADVGVCILAIINAIRALRIK